MIKEILDYFNPVDYLGIWLTITFVLAFIVSFLSFPTILFVAHEKHLMDEPGERSMHSTKIPTLGGIGIFLSIVVVITTIGALLDTKILLLLLGGLTLLFFLGLKDDLLILSPKKKFVGQLIAAGLLMIFTDTRISSLHGLLDIYILPYWVSVIFTLFVYLLIINAFNLIDGIDGLAGSLGLFASAMFAIVFISAKDVSMATISIALIGALVPFLRLNFSRNHKIFMGDTGSMLVGFLIAFFAVRFIGSSQSMDYSQYYKSAPILALSFVFFPLLDTLRIFLFRMFILKKSPFEADNNHLHHKFLQLGFSHIQTTGWVVAINGVLVMITYWCSDWDIHVQLFTLISSGVTLYSIFFIYNWIKRVKLNTKISQIALRVSEQLNIF
ncbi:MraY family glycosyltransferase [Mangrovimonas futianensis]|uniref:MraY family glycosyltransferase n=1 Tax=Mangrovimonas futianensis TaxID=2895523 RepID=UPI001E2C03CC|nr:MraY family glycosyltransferase [Mangrovimonas futianensis]MCF1420236.1 undecaprenyl/decaprenyl-phosphate alpha-N-acetylglucosaminyl 1-phosphate transferase [Mangrovimonas futianensis]